MDKVMVRRMLWRFGRAFVASAISSMILVNPLTMGASWGDLWAWLSALAFAGFVGGITGFLQAGDLYFRNQ